MRPALVSTVVVKRVREGCVGRAFLAGPDAVRPCGGSVWVAHRPRCAGTVRLAILHAMLANNISQSTQDVRLVVAPLRLSSLICSSKRSKAKFHTMLVSAKKRLIHKTRPGKLALSTAFWASCVRAVFETTSFAHLCDSACEQALPNAILLLLLCILLLYVS